MCADKRNKYAEQNHYAKQERQHNIISKGHEVWNVVFGKKNKCNNYGYGYNASERAVNKRPDIHWPCDEPPGCTDHLHCFDEKPVAKHRESNRIVNEENDQYGNNNDDDQ